jgi:cell division protease FtsH
MEENMAKQQVQHTSDSASTRCTQSVKGGSGTTTGTPKPKMPPLRTWLVFAIVLFINYMLAKMLIPGIESPVTIPYTLFKEEVAKYNVQVIYGKGEIITGRFITPVSYTSRSLKSMITASGNASLDNTAISPKAASIQVKTFKTVLPAFADPGLEAFLISHGVEISAEPIQEEPNPLLTLLYKVGPALLFIGFYIWLLRRANQQGDGFLGGIMGIGSSKARRFDQENETRVTFKDVAGIDEAQNELTEIVDFLKDPEKYTRLGGFAPRGVLLIGSPGTGKTLLAKAVAGEAGVPFYSMSASEFVEMIVGVGAARVRDLFKQARENAPAIIFIDELDAIGRARGPVSVGGSSEQEQTLNQILTEMDGFSNRTGIIVLAATNQPDVLDKALLRPGRFDRRVIVHPPDQKGRKAILKVHTREVPLAIDVNLEEIAAITPGFTGADLKNLVNEAALLAAQHRGNEVHHKDFLDSLEKIVLGPERPLLLSVPDKERIAYHESGHAILGLLIPGADPVKRITIVPRGQALGVTYSRADADRYNYTEAYLRAKIIGMLGGRVAEELVYGNKTTGAENDIEQATNLARMMVTRWGMSEALGLVQLAPRENPYLSGTGSYGREKPFSEETAKTIDAEIQKIINESYKEAIRLVTIHRKQLDALAGALIRQETLDEQEILEVTGLPPAPTLDTGKLAITEA